MLMFLIMFLPLFLTVYCLKVRTQKIIPVVLIGVLSSVLVVIFKMFFMLSHRVVLYSYSSNIIYCLIKETLLPVIILYTLYFIISKDNVEFKINTFLPLMLSFYSVYLPYCIISTTDSSTYSLYSLFLKPVVFGIMIAQTGVSVRDYYRSYKTKRRWGMFINTVLILFYLIAPAVIETVYLMNVNLFIFVVFSLFYLCLSIFLFLINKNVIFENRV